MLLNPETLSQETEQERADRQKRTGVYGEGRFVRCHPFEEDPEIVRMQHRAVCLARPYAACYLCPHKDFSLFFNEPSVRALCVQCPRWVSQASQIRGDSPNSYAQTELATCESKPFLYCPSCPSIDDLAEIGLDKGVPGWFGRWRNINKED